MAMFIWPLDTNGSKTELKSEMCDGDLMVVLFWLMKVICSDMDATASKIAKILS